jgi:hypothetical protein
MDRWTLRYFLNYFSPCVMTFDFDRPQQNYLPLFGNISRLVSPCCLCDHVLVYTHMNIGATLQAGKSRVQVPMRWIF